MKKQWISLSFLASSVLVFSQELPKSENYIHSRVYLEETQETNAAKKQLETVAYYDGLGRPKQNIGVKTSPKGRDVVTHIEYDEFGRQAKDFLPIPQSGTQAGRIYDSPLSNASSIYGNEKIFSEKILENSPLNRLLGQIHQGNDWQNHPIRIEYEANTVSDRVKKFKTVTQWNGGATLSSLSQEGVFSSSSLYKNITEDEDGNTSIEFKNGQEQVVLVRKFNGSETADTYYIYNEYNQLAFVISPLAAEKANLTQDDLDRLCYQYRYDGKGRLVEKKLPAKGWEYMVYDKLDRLTMSQDAGQRAKKEWLFTRYDRFGRVAYTGIATGESRAVEQANLNLTLSNHVERTPNAGFTQNNMKVYYNPAIGGEISYPKNIKKLLSVNYYDEYPPDAPAAPENILGQPLMASATAGGKSTKSLPLAVYLKNIENDDWSRTFTYYDQKARVIGTLHHNYLVGYTQIQMELDFAGVVQKTHTYHKRDTKSPEVKIEERFVYDHQNRLVKYFHKINRRNEELLLENIYDELGRLSKKKVGGSEGSPLQEVDYAYNIRGWLTSVNQPQNLGKDLFGFELKYQNPVSNGKDTPKYNGNISQMDWKTRSNNEELRRYTYQYDDLNRLTKSFYSKPLAVQPNTGSYDEYLSYDVNGNIKTLSRFGDMDKPQAVKIDELSYTYIGNQLVKVSDNSQNPSGYPIGGGVIPYDENGNMMNHNDKGISYIGYNHLNLPSAVFWNGKQTFYLYRADGVKVKKDFPGKVTDYLDGFQYENGALQFVPTAEGYYDFVKQRYVYNYTDHLGNIRLSYAKNNNAALEILEENNYYAFGLKHQGYGGVNLGNPNYHYKYNGKELQENSMYDYGARLYMPDIGRWGVQDMKSEAYYNYSQYQYTLNNPIISIDIEGQWTVTRHYNMTYNSLSKAGYGKKQANIIAHYASVFADNPKNHIHLNNLVHLTSKQMYYRKDIDYSPTTNSQNTNYEGYGYNYNIWHSMRSYWEKDKGYTAEEAMRRGMLFGWQKIFDSAKKGKKLSELGINSKEIQDFGQGIHALQDAYAHYGRHDVGADHIKTDIFGDTEQAEFITTSAINVHNLLTREYDKIITGFNGNIKFSFEGMSSSMKTQIINKIYDYINYSKKKNKEKQ